MFSLLGVAVGAAYHVVSAYVQVLAPVTGSLATVAAIIAFTITVRLLLLPLSLSAASGQASQARLLPQVTELRQRHAGHPDRLRIELNALYQRENASALAGCLPALIQLPFFSVMYRLFLDRTVNGGPNGLLSHSLLGAPLGSHWLTGAGPLSAQGAVFLALLGLIAAVAWVSARAARRAGAPAGPSQSAGPARRAGTAKPAGAAATGRRRSTIRGGGRLADPGAALPDGRDRRRGAAGRRHLPAHHDGVDHCRAVATAAPDPAAGPAGWQPGQPRPCARVAGRPERSPTLGRTPSERARFELAWEALCGKACRSAPSWWTAPAGRVGPDGLGRTVAAAAGP